MSGGRPPLSRLGDTDLDIVQPLRETRFNGRRRLLIASALLVVVIGALASIGPAALRSPHRREGILPGLTLEATINARGLVVTSVQTNSIADDAGIEAGDRIVSLDTQQINSIADVQHYLDQKHPDVIEIKLARSDKPMEVIYAFPQGTTQ